ncbi:3-hydroxyacyl-CoA dehydrogenase NAD-binding domain-containing protein [Paenibacillus apiarius]|uniref:3-hydroxyacyl-CoA dehydrogenase NAD-binding domain-containing protein n=1 Tax=Paenibacillus apiarius TaxID=46240 RepID=A0ABT4DX58_9BACL|nr:3-hydroxyacyl-CoA dehydrogenase NAD-binding domain-containing protein [Paenibacillus apiarius]MCY9515715.1 3-hydroxyacyl-CoA dehydrogenase NAD-binding domain-containing protein [Paenibacillus apiarius]MCY9521952.1 3-hydroxyacyl-CoA dehydrogenase NAD-binding domain-containing protein [Paenibacillus apiarius]MCY9550498.1 3-hydroxyacyl-CoA dehydrogenase NAD-binding domain-containing protein [Paenibacillus apiarius]MCY9559853.1 3-hydroxyacyl-CoA dehydrogenase NAD-binding domain-containing protei
MEVTHPVGVVGAGTMGAGIALVCARQGHRVYLHDIKQDILDKAQSYIASILTKDAAKGSISEEQKQKTYELVEPVQDIAMLGECGIVIEAVPEKLELKRAIFARLTDLCRRDALLLSNTSSLSITEIAGGLPHPERIIGFHFFNPAPVMPLVEVIRGHRSGEEATEAAYRFAKELGKAPVLAADSPGFIVNRVARPYYNEALRIMGDRIAGAEQIDRIMKQAGGFKMGPFELQDLIGIDINFATTESVYTRFFHESRFKPSRIQQRMVQAGSLGRKTGEGYYPYDN